MAKDITIKIGDRILYRPDFGGGVQTEAEVTGIEVCEYGEKYGEPVDEYTGDPERLTLDLDNGHWAYGEQVDEVLGQQAANTRAGRAC